MPALVFLLLLAFFVSATDICVDITPPTAPASLSIADSPYDADGNVLLSWSAASDSPACSGIDHYNIYMSTSPDSGFVKIGQTSSLSFAKNSLTNGVKYYFYITAVDKIIYNPNEGPASNTASTTIGTAPSSGGGGGGGSRGGGGGGTTTTTDEWNCGNWSACVNGEQTQDCTHKTIAGVIKKNTRDCVEETTSGEEAVIVSDESTSGEEGAEEATESVEVTPPAPKEEGSPTGAVVGLGGKTLWSLLIILVALIAALFLLFLLKRRRKDSR